ncbi:MAG: colanic acid/amylovoran biosynthesis glycosyltransferase [Frankiales bacterium]|nr:colanic acid/amylovoran biosynthesis glycosyltransferase [Frankiales bacterium]
MTAVLHYLPRWLPPSEQYVHQLLSRSSYRPVVAVRRGVVRPEAFPQQPLVRLDRLLRFLPAAQERRGVAAALALAVRRYGAGLLHAHFGFELDGVVGGARRAGVPLVVSVHGHDVAAGRARQDQALRHALGSADAVVVPSSFLGGHAIACGAREDRVRVLPSGVDRTVFTPQAWPDGPPTAVFVGRFVEKKGLDVLAAAWPQVLAACPAARLLVLGEGPLSPPSQAEVWIPDPARRAQQVRAALARGTVVVTPSRTATDGDSESLLLVNLEAQAVGRAVVSTRHGGIPSAVSADSALLVGEADPTALAEAVVAVLGDPERARRMGAAGPLVAAAFDADVCAARVDALYAELLS